MNQWSRKNPRNSPPFGGQANHSTGCQRKKTWRGLILILSVSLWGYGMAKPTEIHGSNMDLFCTKTWDFITYHCASCSICQFQRKKQLHLPSDTFAIEASERSKHRGRDVLEITCENMSSWPNTAEPVVLKGKKNTVSGVHVAVEIQDLGDHEWFCQSFRISSRKLNMCGRKNTIFI